ncbi:hypothetical protein AVEN_262437-1 [Araneus ventricosus]|uniref:Uncharacterized protein n=1 Tax=Araneus ventricosus TaxID=182803 RepID=A0A4Y2RGW6_ARAVE|nr:hypothetical protein AVEN_262437-1 [Araneus ventricosus]
MHARLQIEYEIITRKDLTLIEYLREIEINRHNIDDLLEQFDEGLRWICEKNKKPKKQKKKPDAIWWNPRLEIKRSVCALRRRFQVQRDPDERLGRQIIFKKAEYKLMIKQSKNRLL